ncbi:MAG: porin [Rickettsiales bacterium]
MKKILLGTSALVGATALFASAANAAQTPKITLGGFSTFQAGFTGEDLDTNQRSGAFRSDNIITVRVDGKSDHGFGYGAGIDLRADTSASADAAGIDSERTYIYLDGKWGKLQGGSDYGVTKTMKIDASSIARATGGIDGDFYYFMNTAGTAYSYSTNSGGTGQVIATPDLFLDYGTGVLGNEGSQAINKISYYTPRFAGFQAGVSYLFDTTAGDRGQTLSRTDNTAGEAENVLLGAISYEGRYQNVGIALAATGEWGNAESNTQEDLRTWQVGGKIDFMGFSLAGSYGDLGDSLRLKSAGNQDDNSFWTVGGAYEIGPFGASVTYLDSEFDTGATHNDFSNLSFGVDYKLAPGLTPYAEVNVVQFDPTGTANDNDATVVLIGTQLAF